MSGFDLSLGLCTLGMWLDGPVGSLVQEVLVLSVFAASCVLWTRLGRRSRGHGTSGKSASKATGLEVNACQQPPKVAPRPQQRLISAPVEVVSVQDLLESSSERQMMNYLEQREFTRALNMYRSIERSDPARAFSEELLSAFIQATVRMGKLDIMEQMLRSMRQRGMVPSCEFWRAILKLASSRKHFQACLLMYSIFKEEMPADKVIFSCLMNAALEVGCPGKAVGMIERYSESGLEPKDYVLLLRIYLPLSDVDGAEVSLRAAGEGATTLMLNLFLSTCVGARQPERGFRLLRELQESTAAEPGSGKMGIADVISYNIMIKGFVEVGSPSLGLVCVRDLLSRGLEPEHVALCSLLDACLAGGTSRSA